MYTITACCFRIWYFLECSSQSIQAYVGQGPSLSSCNSFFMLFIHSVFLLCSFSSHILLLKCCIFFATGCWFLYASSNDLLVEFSIIISECPVLLVLFDFVPVSSFFRQYFLDYFFQLYCQSCLMMFFFSGFYPILSLCIFPSFELLLALVVYLFVLQPSFPI